MSSVRNRSETRTGAKKGVVFASAFDVRSRAPAALRKENKSAHQIFRLQNSHHGRCSRRPPDGASVAAVAPPGAAGGAPRPSSRGGRDGAAPTQLRVDPRAAAAPAARAGRLHHGRHEAAGGPASGHAGPSSPRSSRMAGSGAWSSSTTS